MEHQQLSLILLFGQRKWAIILCLLSIVSLPLSVSALPTNDEQVRRVVAYWLFLDRSPLDTTLGSEVGDVTTINDEFGDPLYHVVSLNPEGFVIVSGDDLVEPIIAFVPEGEFDPSYDTPLGALVGQDLRQRVLNARDHVISQQSLGSTAMDLDLEGAKQKWIQLDQMIPDVTANFRVDEPVDDVRVSPDSFGLSNWDQQIEDSGEQCYNLFTPNNYHSGCVATAMSQVMRFFQHPTTAIPATEFTIYVDGVEEQKTLLGGDGNNSAYNWALMDLGPEILEETHRQAIGYLLHDSGVSVGMKYGSTVSLSSNFKGADALLSTFKYTNASKALLDWEENIPDNARNTIINSNLDAILPVMLSIRRPLADGGWAGHSVISDGYGYNNGTMYHHLNMGWSGRDNAWYNLAESVDVNAARTYTVVPSLVYNIYPVGTGEIISGRVVGPNGLPIENASVTAELHGGDCEPGTGNCTTSTDGYGIYAFPGIPPSATYTIAVQKNGYFFNSLERSTGLSVDGTITTGNLWGVDFQGALHSLATVTTQAVTDVDATTAVANGAITAAGHPDPFEHGVCWNTTGAPIGYVNCTTQGPATTGVFTSTMTGLTPDTTYYVQAYATNSAGNSVGEVVSFTTSPYRLPTVFTAAVTDIGTINATGNGSIFSYGNPTLMTQHGFCWSTSLNPDVSDNCTQQGAITKELSFSGTISGLTPGTTYSVRAYASNTAGTAYGVNRSFTTTSSAEPIITGDVSSITATGATGSGYIDVGTITLTEHGLCWSKNPDPTISDSCSNEGAASKNTSFTSPITGLAVGGSYYVRAYGYIVSDTVQYGDNVLFTTASYPSLSTQAATNIETFSVTGNSTISSLGSPSPTEHGICWNTSGSPSLADQCTEQGAVYATGAFSSSITILFSNTTYYARSYVINSAGIKYGNEVSFTTAATAEIFPWALFLPAIFPK